MSEEIKQETVETTETQHTEQAEITENAAPGTETKETTESKPDKVFTQAEVDEMIRKRLERDRETVSKKAAQEARDAWVAEQGWQDFKGNPIKTEAQYKEALKEQEIRKKYEGKVDDDILQELIESKKFREEYTKQQEESARRAKEEDDYKQFIDTFPDAKPEDIPQSVWDEVNKGRSLVDAFTRHENQKLKEQLKSLTEQKEVEKLNAENAAASTGSTTGQGTATATRFTREQVAKMSEAEVAKNWKAINQSMKTWE